MCGIAGLIGKTAARSTVERMIASIAHRGPDDQGAWSDPALPVALGHCRLSIIDLSHAAAQPMVSENEDAVLVFNGEIYNYLDLRRELSGLGCAFRTSSDTEVLLWALQQWGEAALDRISGMFAFAFFDRNQQRLLLARDRCGQKPLYYIHDGDSFAFASEIKALMAADVVERRLHDRGLQDYLTYGYTLGPYTLLENVRKLCPGECLSLDLSTLRCQCRRYWSLPEPSAEAKSIEEIEEECEALLRQAVRRHLQADVPVSVLLSGGLDSSLITALAAEVSDEPVGTHTVIFPGFEKFDEARYARQIADVFGTRHQELNVADTGPEILETLARQFDEPIADHAIVPMLLLSQAVRKHHKVTLGGDGGDELFGGYPHSQLALHQERIRRYVPALLREGTSKLASRLLPPGAKGRNHLIGLRGDTADAVAQINLYFDELWRTRLLGRSADGKSAEARKALFAAPGQCALEQVFRSDFCSTLPEGYLAKIDRASMLASLEVRAPFLDDALVDYSWRHVPPSCKVAAKQRKIILRRLARKLLPANLESTRKQGLTMPLYHWMDGAWGRRMREVLLDPSQKLFSHGAVQELFDLQKRGYANQGRLFALTMLTLWKREYQVSM